MLEIYLCLDFETYQNRFTWAKKVENVNILYRSIL